MQLFSYLSTNEEKKATILRRTLVRAACRNLIASLVSLSAPGTAVFAQAPLTATGNQSLVYQGRIVRPDGSVPNSGMINFTLSVYSPAPGNCLLYSETQSIDMTGSLGMFNLKLGEGTRTDGGTHPYLSIFVNGSTLTGLACSTGNSYAAAASDERKLRVTFNDGGNVVNLSAVAIKSVPFALQAHQIDGWGLNNLVKVHPTISSPTTFTTVELAHVKAMGAGIGVAGCSANEILKWNGSAWLCSPDATGAAPGDAGYGSAAKGVVAFDTDAATSGIDVSSGVAKLSNTLVSSGTFGSANSVAQFVVDLQGRIRSASSVTIAIDPQQISSQGALSGQVLKWNGSA